jgi:excisionase family DNA binding protein
MQRLLTVDEAAEAMNTTTRFVRRLVAERRIPFTRLGRHVRIAAEDVEEFVNAGRVEPLTMASVWRVRAGR